MTARLHYWYLTHPRWGRPALLLAALHTLSIITVCAAPRASASTNTMVLNFTGLKDTFGVPIGDYYLSIASIPEQLTRGGPHVGIDPASWMQWTIHALTVFAGQFTQSTILTAEAGAFVGIIAIALWIMKITVSTYWLTVIGEVARAIATAVIHVTTELGLLLLAIPIGVFTGAVTIKRGEAGRGATMILIALTMPALATAIFGDPAGEMYGPDGLLAFGRRVGFSVAEAATHNGAIGDGHLGHVDSLTASLITHTVREPLQLWNFGHVVDGVGGCGTAWSAAVRTGAPDAPIHAMGVCGDRAAMAYAQHLDGTNIWVGVVFVVAAVLLGFFMVASGWAVLKVSVKAIWTTVILLPTLWLGSIPGAPQRRALDVVWQFFRHGIEVLVYIVYVSVIGLAIEGLVSRPLPTELGGTSPFAHVLMMGAAAIAAFILLRHIHTDLADPPHGHGMIGRAADVALGMGMHAAFGAAGSAALKGAKGLRARLRSRRGQTPWEQADSAANDARQVHGDPQPGYDPVPNASDVPSGQAQAAGEPWAGTPPTGSGDADGGAASGGAGGRAAAAVAPRRGRRTDGEAGLQPGGEGGRPADPISADTPAVPVISESAESGQPADIPIPTPEEVVSLDDKPSPPNADWPPPQPPTTVDPIET